jgi:hypothetical protein
MFIWSLTVHEALFFPNYNNDYPSIHHARLIVLLNYILCFLQSFEYVILIIKRPSILKEFMVFITDTKALLNLIYVVMNFTLTSLQFRVQFYEWVPADVVFY